MHVEVVLLLMILGWAAFLFGILYFFCYVIGVVGRGVFGAFKRRPVNGRRTGPVEGARMLVCPRADCRTVEVRDARFCSRCGTPLNC